MKTNERVLTLVNQLNEMSLVRMASALESLYRSKEFAGINNIDLLERIIDPAYQETSSKKIEGRLKRANLKGSPQSIDNCVDSKNRSYLPLHIVSKLQTLDFVEEGLNICILGPSDSGKSYLAKALAIQACIKYRVAYFHCEEFLEQLVALKESSYEKFQKKMRFYMKLDLVVLDDFLLHTITDEREVKVLFDIMEKRSELSRSTIICSQRDPVSWKAMILNDEVSSNSIVKRATKHYTVVIKPTK